MDAIEPAIAKLAPLGRALWNDMTTGRTLDGPTRLLALQAARLADRLDRLEAALRSKGLWLRVVEEHDVSPDTKKIVVQVDSVLAEARQTALALNTILHKLGVGRLSDASSTSESDFWQILKDIQADRLPGTEDTAQSPRGFEHR